MARRTKTTTRKSAKKSARKKARSRRAAPAAAAAPDAAALAADLKEREALRRNKIFPRNLTARAAYLVPGNPVVTRPEDTVANCFPGLEIDLRNLDRRFFPGLVFEFISDGAKLAYVDLYRDPDLLLDTPAAKALSKKLTELYDEEDGKLYTGDWFLDWIEQKGRRFSMRDQWDSQVWRMVRSLELGRVDIRLRELKSRKTVTLAGWRRRFTDEQTGVINAAYQPGELMQGLCSPWQHDFRDCSCFYWAANHPDIVLGEVYPGETVPFADDTLAQAAAANPNAPPPEETPFDPNFPLDWLRTDRTRAREAEAFETIEKNRPNQLDHFQVNKVWQDLNIVVEGREIGGLYVPQSIDTANPYPTPGALAAKLAGTLGPLEIALTFEYLFARSSLLGEAAAMRKSEALGGVVTLAREYLLLTAASEMQHLRWVNQMLWGLYHAKRIPDKDFPEQQFKPVLVPATEVPTSTLTALTYTVPKDAQNRKELRSDLVGAFIDTERRSSMSEAAAAAVAGKGLRPRTEPGLNAFRPAALRLLTPAVIDDFIAVEHPSAFIDGAYASVVTTLRQPEYPEHMVGLAERIASDGLQHEKRFREIKAALSIFFKEPIGDGKDEKQPYLQPGFREGTAREADRAVKPLRTIKQNLRDAYTAAAGNEFGRSGEGIAAARMAMTELLKISEDLAERGIGIPYFKLWNNIP